MALRQNKRLARVGLAEFIGLLLICIAAVFVTRWWEGERSAAYVQTDGRVIEGSVKLTHYNATDMRQKTTVSYEYMAGGNTYTSSWTGFWPEDDSPNALPADRLKELCVKGHPLVVMYDPENPAVSFLHLAGTDNAALRQGLALGACVLALLYCAVLYPAWRLRL